MHFPERWGYLQFVKNKEGKEPTFHIPYTDLQKRYLWLIYYLQQQYHQHHHSYANRLTDLNIKENQYDINGKTNAITVQGSLFQFNATVTDNYGNSWYINNDGLIQSYNSQQ